MHFQYYTVVVNNVENDEEKKTSDYMAPEDVFVYVNITTENSMWRNIASFFFFFPLFPQN